MKVGDLVWVVDALTIYPVSQGRPYEVVPGLITGLPGFEQDITSSRGCETLVNGRIREHYIDNVFTSKPQAEKRAKELCEYAAGRKGVTYLDAGFVYTPYVPLEVTPTLIV